MQAFFRERKELLLQSRKHYGVFYKSLRGKANPPRACIHSIAIKKDPETILLKGLLHNLKNR